MSVLVLCRQAAWSELLHPKRDSKGLSMSQRAAGEVRYETRTVPVGEESPAQIQKTRALQIPQLLEHAMIDVDRLFGVTARQIIIRPLMGDGITHFVRLPRLFKVRKITRLNLL